jgi:hypothetical protein
VISKVLGDAGINFEVTPFQCSEWLELAVNSQRFKIEKSQPKTRVPKTGTWATRPDRTHENRKDADCAKHQSLAGVRQGRKDRDVMLSPTSRLMARIALGRT